MDTHANYRLVADGTVANAVPGTAVQLSATSIPSRVVLVTALAENQGPITIGASTTKATAGAGRGVQLAAGQTYEFHVSDVSLLWMDAQHAADAVSFMSLSKTE